jgi:L-galactose dehydrogenase/L-glyceraldehyde 3-phosphate reductase
MRYRQLGRTGLAISEIGFGCGAGAGLMIRDEPEAQQAAVARALELGVNYFDTAPIYGATRSEHYLGRALAALDATPIVATKIALELDQLDDIPAAVVASVEGSLERLQRDTIEVVHLHNRVGSRRAAKVDIGVGALLTVDDVLGPRGVHVGVEQLRKHGLIRAFGCCAYGGETAALDQLVSSGRFDSMLVHYNLINQTAWRKNAGGNTIVDYGEIAARAAAQHMGTVVLRVLEAGLLADNVRPESSPNLDADRVLVPALSFLRNADGRLGPAAIRFALSNPDVSTVLVGVSELHHIEEAVAASAEGPLSAGELARIESVRVANYA